MFFYSSRNYQATIHLLGDILITFFDGFGDQLTDIMQQFDSLSAKSLEQMILRGFGYFSL